MDLALDLSLLTPCFELCRTRRTLPGGAIDFAGGSFWRFIFTAIKSQLMTNLTLALRSQPNTIAPILPTKISNNFDVRQKFPNKLLVYMTASIAAAVRPFNTMSHPRPRVMP